MVCCFVYGTETALRFTEADTTLSASFFGAMALFKYFRNQAALLELEMHVYNSIIIFIRLLFMVCFLLISL